LVLGGILGAACIGAQCLAQVLAGLSQEVLWAMCDMFQQ